MADLSNRLAEIGENDSFFKTLDERLHYTSKDGFGAIWDQYNSKQRLTEEELARVMGLLNTEAGDYAIAPVNINMGFSAGLIVCKIETVAMEYTAEVVLSFIEKQLPATVNWNKMAEVYMGKRNLELLYLIGMENPSPNHSRYDY